MNNQPTSTVPSGQNNTPTNNNSSANPTHPASNSSSNTPSVIPTSHAQTTNTSTNASTSNISSRPNTSQNAPPPQNPGSHNNTGGSHQYYSTNSAPPHLLHNMPTQHASATAAPAPPHGFHNRSSMYHQQQPPPPPHMQFGTLQHVPHMQQTQQQQPSQQQQRNNINNSQASLSQTNLSQSTLSQSNSSQISNNAANISQNQQNLPGTGQQATGINQLANSIVPQQNNSVSNDSAMKSPKTEISDKIENDSNNNPESIESAVKTESIDKDDDKDKNKAVSTEQKKLYQSVLVTLFEKNKYPSLPELETASAETGQPLKRIRGWFQSQRNKERKKQGLIGSGKRLSEAEEAALKEAASAKNGGFSGAPSVVKQESMDISGEMSDSMNKTYEFPSPSGPLGQHDQNNPETLSSPKQKAPAKRKKSKDKDKAQPVTNTSMQNSLSSTGMINSMNSRFPMHPIPSGFFGQQQMHNGYHHPSQVRYNRPPHLDALSRPSSSSSSSHQLQHTAAPQGLQTCPPQIGSRPSFTFPPSKAQIDEADFCSTSPAGRSSSYRSSDDMDVGYSSTVKKDDNYGLGVFTRSLSVADPMGLAVALECTGLDFDKEKKEDEKNSSNEVYDPLDMRNIICHQSRETLDLNAIDSYYDKHT